MSLDNKKDNPIQKEYDDKFDPIKQAEQKGTASGNKNSSSSIKHGETNPNWINNVTGLGGSGRGNNTSSTAGKKGSLSLIHI